jgi:putative endonuclease
MKYYVYVIKSGKDGSWYKGITDNLERRLNQHNSGKNKSTKGKGPYEMVYFEECENRIEARVREKYFKSGIGREQLKNLI